MSGRIPRWVSCHRSQREPAFMAAMARRAAILVRHTSAIRVWWPRSESGSVDLRVRLGRVGDSVVAVWQCGEDMVRR